MSQACRGPHVDEHRYTQRIDTNKKTKYENYVNEFYFSRVLNIKHTVNWRKIKLKKKMWKCSPPSFLRSSKINSSCFPFSNKTYTLRCGSYNISRMPDLNSRCSCQHSYVSYPEDRGFQGQPDTGVFVAFQSLDENSKISPLTIWIPKLKRKHFSAQRSSTSKTALLCLKNHKFRPTFPVKSRINIKMSMECGRMYRQRGTEARR